MRVNARSSRSARDESGAIAVIVALVSIVLFAGAAFAIDAGNVWQTRRQMVTASDASALAAAGRYAEGGDGCATTAAATLAANRGDATLEDCLPAAGTDEGHVTVRGSTTADFTFAGVFGLDDTEVESATTAEWGIPSGVRGLRPFGLCIDANQQLKTWLNLPAGPTGPSGTVEITYGKAQPDACGTDAPGNWGVLDLDGGSNSNADTKEWTLNGYPGTVSVGDLVAGDTGAFSNSLNSELATLKASGDLFPLPVFDQVSGNGSNARFRIRAFVYVRLLAYKTTGSQANRSLTLQFDRGVVAGTCCGSGPDTGVRVVRICDVDTTAPDTTDPRAC